ncbi:hypothetical protein DFA_08376 [Cavenderia fasciculata]|uniref:Uncharacterized protein n=1 Tax=Cavenderia fasciculata TaxID=261658 RepID=F4Q5X2_CACFS|nr:uncharacterized protein DFA_08376 [Cavenderia fasciculata]EGG17381.1 hypothetical protein DFA_08376 [Cavenderia fasciculata]|eukprot:XP_004355865.1 hypothetical protein DFA_08376 [Cavenderia fasciculata]
MLNKFIKTSSISAATQIKISTTSSPSLHLNNHHHLCNISTTTPITTTTCTNSQYYTYNNNNNNRMEPSTATATATTQASINQATSFLDALSLNTTPNTSSPLSTSPSASSSSPKKQPYYPKQLQNKKNAFTLPSSPTLGAISKESLQYVYDEFKLGEKDVQPFQAVDPLNDANTIQGVTVKQSGDFIILRVNNVELTKCQYIHVAPKLKKYQPSLLPNTTFKSYFLANKWNGMNIQFFKYFDANGKVYVSARPRVSNFISNDKKSNTLEVVQDILASPQDDSKMVKNLLEILKTSMSCRSMVFELCGSRVAHIVKYNFAANLQPLFEISNDGFIKPFIPLAAESAAADPTLGLVTLDEPSTLKNLSNLVKDIKESLLEVNKKFRVDNGLSENMYWYNHFLQEGRVLYILDENGQQLVNDSILAIKPADTDKFHWEQFDSGIQTKVLMIAQELREKGSAVDKQSLRRELDLDEFSWAKWEDDIMDLAVLPEFNSGYKTSAKPGKQSAGDQQATTGASAAVKHVILTVGYPASGKSYFAQKLTELGKWKRVNQDEMGTRKKCEDILITQLKAGESVIVDRCNFDIQQRRVWIKLAQMYGATNIHILWFKPDVETCKKRIVVRENHPTIPKGEEGVQIIDKFQSMFIAPSTAEGFENIQLIQTEQESDEAIQKYIQLLEQHDEEQDNTTTTTTVTAE